MSPWQVLRAHRATRAGWGYRVHGPGVSVHYSTAPAVAAVAPDGSSSFCLSREKLTLQQLNGRLASFLQQVRCLEAANQRLERQIQEELDRKCPRERGRLDGHLRTASLLQDQISECLSAEAQVRLQLLAAELTVFDFRVRCEKERERRGCVEAELSDLRLLEEVLKIHIVPELQSLLNSQTQQVMELQIQHQQDTQGLLAQVSEGVAVEMQSAGSSDLIQQLDKLRQTGVTLLNKKQNECWFNAQVSMSTPEVTFDLPARSEIQGELVELRRTAASLEEELTHLHGLNMVLEASGLEQTESFIQQLVVLQQRADGLCRDLDSALQAAAQQAVDHQVLLDIKSRLEAEIQDYRRLLDGLGRQGVSSLHSNSVATSFCATTSSSAFRKNITANKTFSVQGGNLRTMGHQTVPRGHRQTPVAAPLPETVTTVQSIRVHNKNSPVRLINTSNLTGSFHKSKNQRTGALSEGTLGKSMCISATVNRKHSPVEDKVQTKDCDLQSQSIVSTQISQVFEEGAVVMASKLEIKPAQAISMLVPDTQSAKTVVVLAKPESLNYNQTTTEAGLGNIKTGGNIQTEIIKTVVCAEPEVKQDPHYTAYTTTTDPIKGNAAEVKKETGTVSLSLETPAEAAGDTGEVAVTASVVSRSLRSEEAPDKVSGEGAVDKASKLEINTTQGIGTLVPDTQSAETAVVQATKTGTNIQTEITKNILCAEPEVKQSPHFIIHTTTTDPSKQTAVEVRKETGTVISAQIIGTEGSIQAKNQDPAQVESLSLETPAETVRDAGKVAITASCEVCGELILIDDKDTEIVEKRGEEEVERTSNVSNSKQNKVIEDADTESGDSTASSGSPDSKDNLEFKTASTGILKKVELGLNKWKVINAFHETHKIKEDSTESDNDIANLAGQEEVLSTTKSKSVSLTDSGVALSSSDYEETLSPSEAHVFVSPTKPLACLSPETCLSPVETEVLMSMTNQVFFPVVPEEHVRSPDSLLSPNDPAMFLPIDSDTCLSPVEAKGSLSPNGEEDDEDVCLNITEANAHVRPVEKYILSTKEEGQSLPFSRDQALPEAEDRKRKDSIPVRDGDSLCFGSLKGNEGGRDKPTSRGVGHQLSSLGGLEFGDPGDRSIIADKEEQLGFRGLYWRRSPRDRYKDTRGDADNKDVQNQGGRYSSEYQKENFRMDSEVGGQKNSDWLVANKPGNIEKVFKAASFGSVPDNGGIIFSSVASNSGGSAMVASFGGMAANSSGAVSGNAEADATAEVQGRFRHGSGDWMVYGSSLGHTSTTLPSTGSEGSLSGAMVLATSQPETGRFGSRGSGEWVVYGGSHGRKNSMDGGTSLLSEGKEEGPSVATNPATSPQETGRFSSRGSGEWMVYGGSFGSKSRLPRTGGKESPTVVMLPATSPPDTKNFGSGGSGEGMVYSGSLKRTGSLPITKNRESLPMAMHLPTSPPDTGRFGSRGSGEWKVYGGSTGRMSSGAGCDSLHNADSKESPSVAMELATSPPGARRAQRFGSGDSEEWKVYGGSTGRLSCASSNYVISPPSSNTSRRSRLSSAGSGCNLSSGSVVRRSSSVGSAGRLSNSSSGSKLSSSPGSSESKPIYSSASGRRSTVVSAGRSGGVGTTSSQRAPSPGGRMSVGSGGWLSTSAASGSRISSPGSGSKLSSAGGSDRISSRAGGRISNSAGSGRTNKTGGRVISSSDRPIKSTGSGAGGNKERISVCKMAALSISAAGRAKSQERQRPAQWSQQQLQQQAAASSPLIQHWLTSGVVVTSAEPDGLDDIMRL